MNFFEDANRRISKMNWIDIALLKIVVLGFGFMFAKLFPVLLTLPWYWYGIIIIIPYFFLMNKYLRS